MIKFFPAILLITSVIAADGDTIDEPRPIHLVGHPTTVDIKEDAPAPTPQASTTKKWWKCLSCCATTTGIALEIGGQISGQSPVVRAGRVLEATGKTAGLIADSMDLKH